MVSVKQGEIKYHFWVFGMTQLYIYISHLVHHKPIKLINDNQHSYNIYIYIYIYMENQQISILKSVDFVHK